MKKLFATIILAVVLACTAVGTAFADFSEGYLYYTVGNESVTITGCFGHQEELTVPSMIAGCPVNTIAAGAFTGHSDLKKVNLPDTIMTVEEGAFASGIEVSMGGTVVNPGSQDSGNTSSNTSGDSSSGATGSGSGSGLVSSSASDEGEVTLEDSWIEGDNGEGGSGDGSTGSSGSVSAGNSGEESQGFVSDFVSNRNNTAVATVCVIILIVAVAAAAVLVVRKKKNKR